MNLENVKFAQIVFSHLFTRFQSPVIFTQHLKLFQAFRTKAIFVYKTSQFYQFFHDASCFEKVLMLWETLGWSVILRTFNIWSSTSERKPNLSQAHVLQWNQFLHFKTVKELSTFCILQNQLHKTWIILLHSSWEAAALEQM